MSLTNIFIIDSILFFGNFMNKHTKLNHIALQYSDKDKAKQFFVDLLKFERVKDFFVSKKLSEAIFNIPESIDVEVFENDDFRFEIFYTKQQKTDRLSHVCIEIENKKEFISDCKKIGLNPYFVEKEGRKILFVRDHHNNLYEIKEK